MRFLGCALLFYCNGAMAFTLIEIMQQVNIQSTKVTDSFTLETKVQPITESIRGQIFSQLRPGGLQKTSQLNGAMFAANAYSDSRSDVSSGAGLGSSGSGGGDSLSPWFSITTDSLENTFLRTAFHGSTQNAIFGFDIAKSDQFVTGVSVGYETSDFTTEFNFGNERTNGTNVNPYFAWLLSDTWSLDVIGGYGRFKTNQVRATAVIGLPPTIEPVSSKFSSARYFASTNLTNLSTLGNWKLTGSLGYLWSKRDGENYTESNGSAVAGLTRDSKQWNLLGEVAYGRGSAETFLSARYEDILDYQNIEFASGEQPANDSDGVSLSAGWRYFGRDLTANISFNTRMAQEQVRGYGFSMLLRINL
jgi:hypothetical protein